MTNPIGASNMVFIEHIDGYDDQDSIFQFVRKMITRRFSSLGWDQNRPDPSRLVVVKPNWLMECHSLSPEQWESVITHPVVVICVVEALAELMGGWGTVVICDAPITYANFQAILDRGDLRSELDRIRRSASGLSIEVLDLRREVWLVQQDVIVKRFPNMGDPRGYTKVNLGENSLFFGYQGEGRYYGADYDTKVVNAHHRGSIHEYLLAGTSVACDLFINLPKLKTHGKVAISCSLKNLVGINGDKNWLPHETEGYPGNGGDAFPTESAINILESRIKKMGRNIALSKSVLGPWLYLKLRNIGKSFIGDSDTVIRCGNWYGNDTCWRMVLDLNRAFLYTNRDGTMRQNAQMKNYLSIVDGIIGGEGNGPASPNPINSRVLIAGENPAHVDAVACKIMGFDPTDIPLVRESFSPHLWPISDNTIERVQVQHNQLQATVNLRDITASPSRGFRPHFGWAKLKL